MREGEELVEQPFARLIDKNALVAYRHDGSWACMDTFKDKQRLGDMNAHGDCPWEVWKREPGSHDGHEAKGRNGAMAAGTAGRRVPGPGSAGLG